MRLLAGLVAGFLLAATAWVITVLGQEGQPTASTEWIRQAYAMKNARAEQIAEAKLVIVAGSSAMFGIHSDLLAQQYKLPVVNQSVNAGLGLPRIIEKGKAALKPGDIALLPLEYPLFNYHFDTNQVMIDYYFAEQGLFYQQPWQLQLSLISEVPLTRIYEGYRGIPAGFKVTGLYGPQHLNKDGDQTGSDRKLRSNNQLKQLERSGPSLYGADFSATNEAWQILSHFQHWAESQNICLIYIPSTIMYHPYYRENALEASFYRELPAMAGLFGLSYLGDPYDFMYPPKQYFDTNYHLVAEARLENTHNIIKAIGPDIRKHCPGFR